MYRFFRRLFFQLEAERAHYLAMNALKMACTVPFIQKKLAALFHTPASLATEKWGLTFKNPVGLGAGFDKNALYLREIETLGFGFVEIGTVTPLPQAGNEKPRLFRLPKDKALINRMGFNNDGVTAIAARLKKWREANGTNSHNRLIVGGNLGKNKATPNEEAWKDYEIGFNALHPYVDFFVVNVSSPNTPGLRELQEKSALKTILTHLQTLNKNYPVQRPILLKIAPDLTTTQVDDVIDLAQAIHLDGLVATNTTISREGLTTPAGTIKAMGAGGVSGQPLRLRSTDMVHYLHQQTGGTLLLIGSGGIFNGADAEKKLQAGASLIEVWTGFIYEGPFIVKKICNYLNA